MTRLIITQDDGTEVAVAVVPAEATEAMCSAWWETADDLVCDAESDWRAMLSAADPSLLAAVVEMRRACEAAAKTFRWYEQLHTAKGPEHAHKAARNRAEAERLEATLSRIRETDDA